VTLSAHATSPLKAQLQALPGRIEATHFPESGIYAIFTAQERHDGIPVDSPITTLNDDEALTKLEQYMRRSAPDFVETEPSSVMKQTLQQALHLMQERPAEDLLCRILELWICTRIIAGPDRFYVYHSPEQLASLSPTVVRPSSSKSNSVSSQRKLIADSSDAKDSHNAIVGQLLAATERCAASTSKFVMNELERRLLQRQQANPFDTFLVSVILLACVERMCWLFQTYEADTNTDLPTQPKGERRKPSLPHLSEILAQEMAADGRADSAINGPLTPPLSHRTPPAHWPLEQPPAFFAQQGERFSDIVHMLLRMRNIPPKTIVGSSGFLVAVDGDAKGVGAANDAARQWFEAIKLRPGMLAERRDAEFERSDWACWELKFVSKILGA